MSSFEISRGEVNTPVIADVYPSSLGMFGGSTLYITGANFAPNGLSSSTTVIIGTSECEIIRYYSTDSKIRCVAPPGPCVDQSCEVCSGFSCPCPLVNGYVEVRTIDSILRSLVFTIQYCTSRSPFVTDMTNIVWPSSIAFVKIRPSHVVNPKTDISIKISGQYVDLGYDSDKSLFNPLAITNGDAHINLWFRPAMDQVAGFSNLSLIGEIPGGKIIGSGLGRMFGNNVPYFTHPLRAMRSWANDYQWMFTGHSYHFDASPSGIAYSVCVLPVISSISPHIGSLAGGTTITIRGFGFVDFAYNLRVFASGRKCEVISSKPTEIKCITSSSADDISETDAKNLMLGQKLELNSTRPYGSPGIWIKLWGFDNPSGSAYLNCFNDLVCIRSDALKSFSAPWRQGIAFSMRRNFGDDWPSKLSNHKSHFEYHSEARTLLVAPYSGIYIFHFSVPFVGLVYGGDDGGKLMIWQKQGWSEGWFNSLKSEPVRLKRGQRFPLRILTVNANSEDYFGLSLQIKPDRTSIETGAVLVGTFQSLL